jgi:hypothetical protein
MSPIVLFAIKALIATGAVAAAGHWIAAHLPSVNVHTPSAKLNAIIDTLGNACEQVVKAELNGDLLSQVIDAVVNGQAIAGPLSAALPGLKQLVLQQVGPAIQAALAAALGGNDAAERRLTTEVLAAAHAHALETAKTISTLADGRKLVVPTPAVS